MSRDLAYVGKWLLGLLIVLALAAVTMSIVSLSRSSSDEAAKEGAGRSISRSEENGNVSVPMMELVSEPDGSFNWKWNQRGLLRATNKSTDASGASSSSQQLAKVVLTIEKIVDYDRALLASWREGLGEPAEEESEELKEERRILAEREESNKRIRADLLEIRKSLGMEVPEEED